MNAQLQRLIRDSRGVSLMLVIFLIVALGFLGGAAASFISTQSSTATNDVGSTQAFYLAEGGAQFGQRALEENLDWYRSAIDPILIPSTALGAGTFTVNTYLPATLLRRRVTSAATSIPVFSIDRFPASGYLQLDDDIGGGEFVQYTSVTASPPSFNLSSLAGRDVTIGGVNGGAAGAYLRGTHVYPVFILRTTLNPLSGSCVPTPSGTIDLDTHSKLLPMGTISVDSEEITYTGSGPSATAGRTTLTGVVRCANAQTVGAIRGSGYPVTPILNDDAAPDYEAYLVATGAVGTAGRVVQKTVQR